MSTFSLELAYHKAAMITERSACPGDASGTVLHWLVVRDLHFEGLENLFGEDPILCGLFELKLKGDMDVMAFRQCFGNITDHGNPLVV